MPQSQIVARLFKHLRCLQCGNPGLRAMLDAEVGIALVCPQCSARRPVPLPAKIAV